MICSRAATGQNPADTGNEDIFLLAPQTEETDKYSLPPYETIDPASQPPFKSFEENSEDQRAFKDRQPRAVPLLPRTPEVAPSDITRGRLDVMDISLTFDGGGYEGSKEAEAILDTLRERGIKTTIFLTGLFIKRYPELVRQMVRDGHEIGNHTMHHPHLTEFAKNFRQTTLPGVDRAVLKRELKGAAELFKNTTGTEMAPLWRAPFGEVNKELRQWAFEEGYVHIGWTYDYKRKESLDTLDWVHDTSSRLYRSSYEIKKRVLDFGKGSDGARGGIILMHLGTVRKVDKASAVLGEMLDGLMARGYRFIKISALLDGDKVLETVYRQRQEAVMKGLAKLDPDPSASTDPPGEDEFSGQALTQ